MKKKNRIFLLFITLCIFLAFYIFFFREDKKENINIALPKQSEKEIDIDFSQEKPIENPPPEEIITEKPLTQEPLAEEDDILSKMPDETEDLPHDKLFITKERQKYKSGDLYLIIPKLEINLKIYSGVGDDVLAKGVGLFDYAQLPGKGNRNVSLAAHRNGRKNGVVNDRAPFYYIDTIEKGDYMYLRDSKYIYRYTWEDSEIVAEDDWSPIYSQGYSCLSLTSCHPIGISNKRIIVRGRLEKVF